MEETIERIKIQGGVEGYVICNKSGQVLRRFPNMSLEDAEKYALCMINLTNQARGVVRDLDPKVSLVVVKIGFYCSEKFPSLSQFCIDFLNCFAGTRRTN